MQTTIEPTVVPQIIEIPATKQEQELDEMISMVKRGEWCRDYMHGLHGHGEQHCALGMIEFLLST